MSCKEEFDEKLIDCVRSFPVIYDFKAVVVWHGSTKGRLYSVLS